MTTDPKAAEALAPCPFCGSEARPSVENDEWIERSNTQCDALQSGSSFGANRFSAAEAWNRRTPPTPNAGGEGGGIPRWRVEHEVTEAMTYARNYDAPLPKQTEANWNKVHKRAVDNILAAQPAPSQAASTAGEAEALRVRVKELMAEGDGFWRSCSGCHELDEGHATGRFDQAFNCHVGLGCGECGGLGAIWDTTDYEDMARSIMADEAGLAREKRTPSAGAEERGWAYWSPDVGDEWTPCHPVESGETPDAEQVRPMTKAAFLAEHASKQDAEAAP